MVTLEFLKSVLKGDKSLLFTRDVQLSPKLPRYPEIHVPTLWEDLKKDSTVSQYFPNSFIHKKRMPDRNYLLTVR